jgi:hypothetical protein
MKIRFAVLLAVSGLVMPAAIPRGEGTNCLEVKFITSIWSTRPIVRVCGSGADCLTLTDAPGARQTTQIEPTIIPSGLNPDDIFGNNTTNYRRS